MAHHRRITRLSIGAAAVLGFAVAAPALGESAAQSYAASEVRIVNLIGTLEVTVGDEPGIVVDVSGPDGVADDVGIRVEGATLVIARKGMIDHDDRPFDAATYPTVRVTLPKATALTITGMDGLANIGDILAPLIVRAASVDLTAGDLTSVVIDRSGGIHSLLAGSQAVFAVSFLAENQEDLSHRFAFEKEDDRFLLGDWQKATTGAPVLADALAWLDCRVVERHEVGSHRLYVGSVVASATPRADGAPPPARCFSVNSAPP